MDALQDAIFNSANFSSIATDAKGVIQIFNVGAERMLGYSAFEVVDVITPAEISEPRELIDRAGRLSLEFGTRIMPGFESMVFKASRGIEDIYELTYIRKDGSRFPAVVSVTALRDAQGKIIGYLLIGTDNTAHKMAQVALQKASALQDAIFQSASFSSIATDAKGVVQIFNVGAERMLGYSAFEMVDIITPADISDPDEIVARAQALSLELGVTIAPGFEALAFKAAHGLVDVYELTYIRRDGTRLPAVVSVTALRDPHGAIIGYLLIGTDNTLGKRAEAAKDLDDERIRNEQFYTRSLIESNIDGLMMIDPEGVISDVNQQMVALTGCTRDQLIGSPARDCFTDPQLADGVIARVLKENRVSDFELTVRSCDGFETMVSYSAATFHSREGTLKGVIAAARDVTERRRFERELADNNLQLERASRMKSEFLATMSHELRTPLNAIIGFSEVLQDGLVGPLSDTQKGYIGDIFNSGLHLLALVNDILDLSKVEAGMMGLDMEVVDIGQLLRDSLSIVKDKAAAQQIRLELETGDGLGICRLDARKTRQIVYNLLANAVKFSGNGGHVALRARRVPRAAVGKLPGRWPVQAFPFPKWEHDEFVEIRVTDRGIGLSPASMARLFHAFIQIDSSLARKFDGTGLGLATVKELAELQGGTVAVASAEGEGACFSIWLPFVAGATEMALMPGADGLPPLLSRTSQERLALVVEGNDNAAELVRLLLAAEGFAVMRAATAEAALAMLPDPSLTLVTMEIDLPDMDGWEFLRRLRSNPASADLKVVVIAGASDPGLAHSCGASAALQKPVSVAQLKAVLTELGLRSESEELPHTVLVVAGGAVQTDGFAAFLPNPAYAAVRSHAGKGALALARRLRPDLILMDLALPAATKSERTDSPDGFDIVRDLLRDEETAHIPVVLVVSDDVTQQQRSELVGISRHRLWFIESAEFTHDRFVDEASRALATTRT